MTCSWKTTTPKVGRSTRIEVGVQVLRFGPSVPGTQEGADHVGLHRAGTEERDVDDEVVERLGGELADQLTLTR